MVGVFDRSHYEDVLVGPGARARRRGRDRAPLRRDQRLREGASSTTGTVVIKCMLHISAEEQKASGCWPGSTSPTSSGSSSPRTSTSASAGRTTRRPTTIALERCHTDAAPWYVVPSDRKWYRNWAVGQLLLEALRGHAAGVARARLRRRGAAGPAGGRGAGEPRREAGAGDPLRHAAARGRLAARDRRGRRPRHLRLQVPRRRPGAAGAGRRGGRGGRRPAGRRTGTPRAGRPSTSRRRSAATRPTRRCRTCSTPASGSTWAWTSCPARSATTPSLRAGPRARRPDAVARRAVRQRRPLAGATPTCWSGAATCARSTTAPRCTSTTPGRGGSRTDPAAVRARSPTTSSEHILRGYAAEAAAAGRRAGRAGHRRRAGEVLGRGARRVARAGAGRGDARRAARGATSDLPAAPGSAARAPGCPTRRRPR